MYEYRQVLLRMRQGATGREIARSKLMGRKKARQVREIADGRGWLDPGIPLLADAALAEVFTRPPATSSVSPLTQYHDAIQGWVDQNIQQTTILSLLRRRFGYAGSYSSVRRYVGKRLGNSTPTDTPCRCAGRTSTSSAGAPYWTGRRTGIDAS